MLHLCLTNSLCGTLYLREHPVEHDEACLCSCESSSRADCEVEVEGREKCAFNPRCTLLTIMSSALGRCYI